MKRIPYRNWPAMYHPKRNDPLEETNPDAGYVCPQCGESRLGHLTWLEGDTVRCDTCGTEYLTAEEE
jgi:hypothetical protein